MVYSAYVLHRSELLFGPTADKFDPERWSPERAKDVRPFFFVPFHAGPRICLGQNMAYTEARVMLTLLLQVRDRSAGSRPTLDLQRTHRGHSGVCVGGAW